MHCTLTRFPVRSPRAGVRSSIGQARATAAALALSALALSALALIALALIALALIALALIALALDACGGDTMLATVAANVTSDLDRRIVTSDTHEERVRERNADTVTAWRLTGRGAPHPGRIARSMNRRPEGSTGTRWALTGSPGLHGR